MVMHTYLYYFPLSLSLSHLVPRSERWQRPIPAGESMCRCVRTPVLNTLGLNILCTVAARVWHSAGPCPSRRFFHYGSFAGRRSAATRRHRHQRRDRSPPLYSRRAVAQLIREFLALLSNCALVCIMQSCRTLIRRSRQKEVHGGWRKYPLLLQTSSQVCCSWPPLPIHSSGSIYRPTWVTVTSFFRQQWSKWMATEGTRTDWGIGGTTGGKRYNYVSIERDSSPAIKTQVGGHAGILQPE